MGLIEEFSRRTEFTRRVGTIILAVAKAVTPIPELTEPVSFDNTNVAMIAPITTPENETNKLATLFFKSMIENTRYTARINTYQTMYNRGSSLIDGPPRRRPMIYDPKANTLVI